MLVRQARMEDAAQAAELIQLAIKDIAEALTGETEEEKIKKVLRDYFCQEVNRLSYRNTLVAEIEGRAAGIIISYHGSDASELDAPIIAHLHSSGNTNGAVEKEAEDEDYYIDTLSVNPEHWGKRVGTCLVAESEKLAKEKGYKTISLNVEENNIRARKLYSRLGYTASKVITINHHSYEYMVKTL
ncbi:GNAT family N-acetyltransferase [Actinomycetes bacterium NPDC127524]